MCYIVTRCITAVKPALGDVTQVVFYRETPMPKTHFLQIRLSPEDHDRVRQAADAEFLDASTWARRVLLQHLKTSAERPRRGGGQEEDGLH